MLWWVWVSCELWVRTKILHSIAFYGAVSVDVRHAKREKESVAARRQFCCVGKNDEVKRNTDRKRPTVKTPTTTIVFFVCMRRRQRCVEYVLYLNFVSFHCLTVRLGRIGVLFRSWIYLFKAAASPHYHIQALAHTTQTDIIDVLLCFAFVLHVRRFYFSFFLRFFVSNLGRSTLCIHTDSCCWHRHKRTLTWMYSWTDQFISFSSSSLPFE